MNNFKTTEACSPFGLLAFKIVEQAIMDYRALLRGKTVGYQTSIDEIRHFLKGPWCEELLSFTEVDGDWVLERLDKEEAQIASRKRLLTIDGRTENLNVWCNELGVSSSRAYKIYKAQGRRYMEARMASIKKEKGL